MERFSRSLKVERVYHRRYPSREAAKLDVLDYLGFYNSHRRHSAIWYVSPMEFEQFEQKRNVALLSVYGIRATSNQSAQSLTFPSGRLKNGVHLKIQGGVRCWPSP